MNVRFVFLSCLLAVSSHAAIFDLKNDFSNVNNPNGVWSFTAGTTALTHFSAPTDPTNNLHLAFTSGVWAAANSSFNSSVMRTTGGPALTTGYTANDFALGDVLLHSTNPGTGADLFIKWTAPQAGTLTYTGGAWYAHSPVNRSQDFSLALNGGAALASGTLTSAQNRSNIQAFSSVSLISVNAGDVLALRFGPTTGFGSISGVNFTVNFNPTTSGVPEPSTIALLGSALAGLAFFRRRKA